jgi:hypothetical protein
MARPLRLEFAGTLYHGDVSFIDSLPGWYKRGLFVYRQFEKWNNQ